MKESGQRAGRNGLNCFQGCPLSWQCPDQPQDPPSRIPTTATTWRSKYVPKGSAQVEFFAFGNQRCFRTVICMYVTYRGVHWNPGVNTPCNLEGLSMTAPPSLIALQYFFSRPWSRECFHPRKNKIRLAFRKLFPFLYRWVRAKLQVASISFVISCLCPFVYPVAWNSWAPTGRIFMVFDILSIFRKYIEKNRVSSQCDKNVGHYAWIHMYIYNSISPNYS